MYVQVIFNGILSPNVVYTPRSFDYLDVKANLLLRGIYSNCFLNSSLRYNL